MKVGSYERARLTRRGVLISTSALVATAYAPNAFAAEAKAAPLPLSAVRLKPSIFLDAVNTNGAYLLSLEPDRFLHNFHKFAGLPTKGEVYGGWEARSIAGHSLGHYLSACALTYAQTGDERMRARVRTIVSELAAVQAAHGDGYVGGTTVTRDGVEVDGKIIFEEVRRGEIDTEHFDLNGGWVPLYTWHKVHAGLLDAHRHCGDAQALDVARGMGDYLVGVFAGLSDAQVQTVLRTEHGGVNETFAELYARTGDARFLALAERLCHRLVLDPLMNNVDQLAGLHANTQIPKVVGLARLHEVTGAARYGQGANFFWDAVTGRHSYVIGGNSEHEFFGPPGEIANKLSDRTCESCNTYNMLRLTRHLWSWRQDSSYFDYFERAHLNHIMAHQHPETGMKVYFMPLTIGSRRLYSRPTDSFWCCVGSGMESHAKHGESIYWRRDDTLFVNLFIPSSVTWEERGAHFDLDTRFPYGDRVDLTVTRAGRRGSFAVALRLPAWCAAPSLALNGEPVAFYRATGYAIVRRRWRDGDLLTLTLPMAARIERTPDDPNTMAFLSGPLVLAADLGAADRAMAAPAPALPMDAEPSLREVERHVYRVGSRGGELTLRPYFAQYDRWTAPYLQRVSDAEWSARTAAFAEDARDRAALDARTIDVVWLGEDESERAHNFRGRHTDLFSAQGVYCRQAAWGAGNYFEVDLAVGEGPLNLHALYWGDEIDKDFEILVDGHSLGIERRPGPAADVFVPKEYQLPRNLTRGKEKVTIRIQTHGSDARVYALRIVRR